MYSNKFHSLLRPIRQASICPHVLFLRQCHSLFMSTSMPTPLPVPIDASPRFHPRAQMRAHTSCPYKCTCAMPNAWFHADAHAISNICGYVSHRHLSLFFLMIHYLFGYSLLHMNNEWLLINHLFVIIPPMHMPITLSTPRPMPLHMPMPLPMPLLILVPLHLLTLVPSFSQNYQDCFSLPPILQIPIDQLLSNLEHYSPFCFLVYFEYLLSHNQYLLLSLSNY